MTVKEFIQMYKDEYGIDNKDLVLSIVFGLGAATGLHRIMKFVTPAKKNPIGSLALGFFELYTGIVAADKYIEHQIGSNAEIKEFERKKVLRESHYANYADHSHDNIHFADEKEGDDSDVHQLSFTEWLKECRKEDKHGKE